MIGEFVRPAKSQINYLEVAKPLTFEIVHDDISEAETKGYYYYARDLEIVMWKHQWQWIVRETPRGTRYPLPYHQDPSEYFWIRGGSRIETAEVIGQIGYPYDAHPGTLFGVPVKLENP